MNVLRQWTEEKGAEAPSLVLVGKHERQDRLTVVARPDVKFETRVAVSDNHFENHGVGAGTAGLGGDLGHVGDVVEQPAQIVPLLRGGLLEDLKGRVSAGERVPP